ncbi:hypothetical protein B7486_06625 [cyanobacterium TDX16]|nr:hypothetical protein B7486_06625 [cyanobacterium TDX16]
MAALIVAVRTAKGDLGGAVKGAILLAGGRYGRVSEGLSFGGNCSFDSRGPLAEKGRHLFEGIGELRIRQ